MATFSVIFCFYHNFYCSYENFKVIVIIYFYLSKK
jgi:hypothetical protein